MSNCSNGSCGGGCSGGGTSNDGAGEAPVPDGNGGFTRRTAIKAAAATLGATAFAAAIAPLTEFTKDISVDDFLRKHYKELTPEQLDETIRHFEAAAKAEYGADVTIHDPKPIDGVQFAYALNLSICVGCRKCAEACHKENNHDRPSHTSYIRVLEMEQGTIDLEQGNANYDHPVPAKGKYYMPVQCQHCDNAPCVKVCPVEATWKEKDGIVVVDYNWCIGCRYCEAACPYHAQRFNWQKPEIPAEEVNPNQGLLSNRIRPQGVMEKCTFCLHRTREGRLPACRPRPSQTAGWTLARHRGVPRSPSEAPARTVQ